MGVVASPELPCDSAQVPQDERCEIQQAWRTTLANELGEIEGRL